MKALFLVLGLTFSSMQVFANDMKVTVETWPARKALVKTVTVSNAELEKAIISALDEVEGTLAKLKVKHAGPAFIRTLSATKTTYKFEAGFPISAKIKAPSGMSLVALPAGKAAKVSMKGSYADTYKAYPVLEEWIKKNKLSKNGDPIEFFIDDAKKVSPPNQRAEVVYPIK